MEKCLITNKVCPANNKKCKVCKLEDCRKVISMIDTVELKEEKERIEKIREQLPNECKNCSLLVIANSVTEKVYCPYRIKNKCILPMSAKQ